LHALRERSLYFPNFFAQHSMGGSSDAELSTLTGLVPLADSPTMSVHRLSHLPSVARKMTDSGYACVAMHGNTGAYWNRIEAYEQLGFERFYGGESYSGEAAGFESLDHLFFEQSLPRIQDLHQGDRPFFIYMITQTMHGPYRAPITERNRTLDHSEGTTAAYMRAANYTDQAVSAFIEELASAGILQNTTVLIHGDHCTGLFADQYPDSTGSAESVPLFILTPAGNCEHVPTLASHCDLAPTIADLAGVEPSEYWFSRSLLRWYPERAYPVLNGRMPQVLTPAGPLAISAIPEGLCRDLLRYSQSHFYRTQAGDGRPGNPQLSIRYVAHAMGHVDGVTYSNSSAAFRNSYSRGFRAFEVDLAMTSDQRIVCFHEGSESAIGATNQISGLSSSDVQALRFAGKFPVLDAVGLLGMLNEMTDAVVITDVKSDFEAIVPAFLTLARDSSLNLSRVIPQVYSADDVEVIRSLGVGCCILTLYRLPLNDTDVLEVVDRHRDVIRGVCIGETRFSPFLASTLRQQGLAVFVHTVNDRTKVHDYQSQGVTGFYTDGLWHDSVLDAAGQTTRTRELRP